jgi:nucleotide-binding universal stress UspA family protein
VRFSRVLACVDGSVAGMAAADLAVDLAAEDGAQLDVIYVLEPAAGGELAAGLRRSGENNLQAVARSAQSRRVVVKTAFREGVPFEEILAEAARFQADVIVMGRVGQAGPGKKLLGSEAERVVEFAQSPVLIVPSEQTGTGFC